MKNYLKTNQGKAIIIDYDFCKFNECITPISYYDTRIGIAFFILIIPEGHIIDESKTKIEDNVAEYFVKGKTINSKVDFEPMIITGLSKKEGDILKVIVNYDFDVDECIDGLDLLEKKKKDSNVNGHPMV